MAACDVTRQGTTGVAVPAPATGAHDDEGVEHSAATALRVAVVSDQLLLADLAAAALAGVGVHTTTVDWPARGANRALRRRLVTFRPHVCLSLQHLDDPAALRLGSLVLAGDPFLWVVVAATDPGPAWGAALDAGADAVLPGRMTMTELVAALGRASVGEDVMEPGQRAEVTADWQRATERRRALAERLETLTPREVFVLEHLYEGERVSTIACDAGVAEATVRSQVKSVLRKLGVDSQIAAVAAYRQVRSLSSDAAEDRHDDRPDG